MCPVLARRQEQGGGVRRRRGHRGDRGAARKLHDQVISIPVNGTGESITDLIFLILTCFKQVVSNPPPAPGQNHPAAEGRGGAEGDPVPLHRVALPLKPLQQRAARVQEAGAPGQQQHVLHILHILHATHIFFR